MNLVFANRSKENSVYPLTTREIAELQLKDAQLVALTTQDGYSTELDENIKVLCKDGKLVIPKDLQDRAVACIITTYSIQDQRVLKRLFVVRCIGRVCDIPSDHMSKSKAKAQVW